VKSKAAKSKKGKPEKVYSIEKFLTRKSADLATLKITAIIENKSNRKPKKSVNPTNNIAEKQTSPAKDENSFEKENRSQVNYNFSQNKTTSRSPSRFPEHEDSPTKHQESSKKHQGSPTNHQGSPKKSKGSPKKQTTAEKVEIKKEKDALERNSPTCAPPMVMIPMSDLIEDKKPTIRSSDADDDEDSNEEADELFKDYSLTLHHDDPDDPDDPDSPKSAKDDSGSEESGGDTPPVKKKRTIKQRTGPYQILPRLKGEDGKELFPCPKCDFIGKSMSGTFRHRKKVHDGVTYPCKEKGCKKISYTALDNKKHFQSKHLGIKYACDQCDFTCAYLTSLNAHIKRVHNGQIFKCDVCDYTAKQFHTVKIHKQKTHSDVKRRCKECDYVTNMETALKRHIRTWHKNIRYPCDKCDHVATSSGRLTKHRQRIHEGIRFNCPRCDSSLTTAFDLKVHVQAKHDGVKYPCDHCDFVASIKSYLKRHIRKEHPDKPLEPVILWTPKQLKKGSKVVAEK